MQMQRNAPVSGHVYLVKRKRGEQWYAKFRLPNGRQVQRRLGPAHTGSGRPVEGYLTKRTAQAALHSILTDARRGTLAGMVRTGRTVRDAGEEWLRHIEHDRGRKHSTMLEYRSALRAHIVPAFGDVRLESVTPRAIETWRTGLIAEGRLSRRTVNKLVTILYGVFERARHAFDLPANPVAEITRYEENYSGDFDFYSPEEVMAIVRAAESEQDAAVFLTAAFTGLRRGELVALRWRDVDFPGEAIRVRASVTHGELTTPKSGKVRVVPMVPEVAAALAKLGQRERFTGDAELVFPGLAGEYLDGSALRRRYLSALARAGLRPLRFHDLRHTFGSLAINRASIVQVQEWMGHADVKTTMRYLHHKSRAGEAALLADAFRVAEGTEGLERRAVDQD